MFGTRLLLIFVIFLNSNQFLKFCSCEVDWFENTSKSDSPIEERLEYLLSETVKSCRKKNEYMCKDYRNEKYNDEIDILNKKYNLIDDKYDDARIDQLKSNPFFKKFDKNFATLLHQCNHTRLRGEKFIGHFNEFIETLIPDEWPLYKSDWSGENFDWFKLNAKTERLRIDMDLFGFHVDPFYNDSIHLKFRIQSKPHFEIPTDQKLILKKLNQFQSENLDYESAISDILEFEELRQNMTRNFNCEENTLIETNYDTLSEFYEKYPKINWKKFVNTATGHMWDESTPVVVQGEKCLIPLFDMIEGIDRKLMANWMFYNILQSDLNFIRVRGMNSFICIYLINMMKPVDLYVIENYLYDNETRSTIANDLIPSVKRSFESFIRKSTWFADESKEIAIEKVKNCNFLMNFDNNDCVSKYIEVYNNYEVDPKNFYKSYYKLQEQLNPVFYYCHREIEYLDKMYMRYSNDIDTQNFIDQNLSIIPLPFQRPTIFHQNHPKSLQYSILGYRIASELIKHTQDLWETRIVEKFGNLSSCKNDIDLITDLIEIFGVSIALDSYERWILEQSNSTEIDYASRNETSLNTREFFLSFIQYHCVKSYNFWRYSHRMSHGLVLNTDFFPVLGKEHRIYFFFFYMEDLRLRGYYII